jgi:hypothetical protein
MSVTTDNPGAAAVRPFTIPKVPEAELKELRSRIAATRWPDRETVADDSQGVRPAPLVGQRLSASGLATVDIPDLAGFVRR